MDDLARDGRLRPQGTDALTEANDSVAAVGGRQGAEPREQQGNRRTVVKGHRASHADPIALRAGERVSVGRRDTTWPDYVWCAGPDGREGWVPEAFVELADDGTGRARRDYNARELDVAAGDVVLAGEEAGGWLWCEVADGRRGWVPAGCLAPADT